MFRFLHERFGPVWARRIWMFGEALSDVVRFLIPGLAIATLFCITLGFTLVMLWAVQVSLIRWYVVLIPLLIIGVFGVAFLELRENPGRYMARYKKRDLRKRKSKEE